MMLQANQYSAKRSERAGVRPSASANSEATEAESRDGRADIAQHVYTSPVGGIPKRIIDVSLASVTLLFVSPLLLTLWVLVRLESRGAGLFTQSRGGFGGKTFEIYKLRTMSDGDHSPVSAVQNGKHVTRIGKFLRVSSFDELPQLFNVIKGDMSIVGPRPHAIEHDLEFSELDETYAKRFHARPGITGLAQANRSRGPLKTDDEVRQRTAFDVAYVENWSVLCDVKIILLTIWTIVRSDGDH